MSLESVVASVGASCLWVVNLSFLVSLWLAVVVQFRSLSLGEQINRLGKSSDWFLLIVAYYRLGFVYQTANRREYPGSVFFIGEQYVRVALSELYIGECRARISLSFGRSSLSLLRDLSFDLY